MFSIDRDTPLPVAVAPSEAQLAELRLLRAMRDSLATTIQRCHNPSNSDYAYYGGRGITVCDRWRSSFENFLADMGVRPEGHTLERVKNDEGYSKDNCVWATRLEQSQNKRGNKLITWQGKTLTVAAWERELGFKTGTLKARLGPLGYTVEQAFTKRAVCGQKLYDKEYKQRRAPDMSNTPKGYDSPNTRLTPAQVLEARKMFLAEKPSYSEMARRLKVSFTTAKNAVHALGAYKEI